MIAEATNDILIYLFPALLVVIGAVAVLNVSIGLFLLRRCICPECGKKALRCVQWIRATVLVEGKKTPDTRSYYQCDSCRARLKRSLDAGFTVPTEAEWHRYCSAKW